MDCAYSDNQWDRWSLLDVYLMSDWKPTIHSPAWSSHIVSLHHSRTSLGVLQTPPPVASKTFDLYWRQWRRWQHMQNLQILLNLFY